jgi:RNA polymerase sigma factor (sigma-70 family)
MFPQPGQTNWDLEAAWLEFIARFELILVKAIRITCRRYAPTFLLSHEDMKDLIQQVFVKLSDNDYRSLRELKCYKESSVKLYLYAVASNTALDFMRTMQPVQRCQTSQVRENHYVQSNGRQTDQISASGTNPEEEYLQKELMDRVLAVVDKESGEKTKERNRKIFMMAHRDGFTRSEIAASEDIDLKKPGVNSFLNIIKKRLEELYDSGDCTEVENK